MADKSCDNHCYGLWNGSSRVCVKCGYVETLPMSDSIKKENLKQEEAKQVLKQFLVLEDSSFEAVRGIQIVLSQYLHYLDEEALTLFQNKAKAVAVANNLHELSIGCILRYVDKVKRYEDVSWEVHSAFDEFMIIFGKEVEELVTLGEEKKATL